MAYTRERLGQLLVRAGLIDDMQLQACLDAQTREGGKLGEIMVRDLLLTEDQIASTLAQQKDLEHVNLAAYPIDRAVVTMVPLRTARRRQILPLDIENGELVMAMADPLDVEAIDEAELITGMKVRPVVAGATQVKMAIEKFVAGADALQELEIVGRITEDAEDLSDADVDADVVVVRIVNQLIQAAVREKASDIHFEPAEDGVRVRYRVDGVLREAAGLPKTSQAELLSRLKVMAELDITERRRPQDGRFGIRLDGKQIDLRVATLPTPQGEAITLRLLDREVAFLPLEDLGMSDGDLETVRRMLKRPYGAILVAGPTGSGKSTTLYAFLHSVNDPGRKIITVEDPIEYRMENTTQLAVNPRIGLTFAAGLRTILRSDPDVVMVGEVRDPETAEMAVRSALTGHLVLTSIHTNDAPSALTRLTDMGVPPYVTSSGLSGAVAQRLVRKLCTHCKEPATISWDRLVAAGMGEDEAMGLVVYEPKGCQHCGMTGYSGRIAVFEVMEFDDHLESLFIHNAPTFELQQAAIARGMRTLRRDALEKVKAGVTSLDEVDRVVV